MRIIIIAALASLLAGCANLPPDLQKVGDKAQMTFARLTGRGASLDAPLPADAIKARDQGLTASLGKVGQFAAKQTEPMTVTVFAPLADHDYLVRSIRAGVPADKAKAVTVQAVADTVNAPRVAVRSTREASKGMN
ncbi:hypothetical protein ACEU07_20965 [Chromobacterium violaceum]|uniref:hypothetical protein n=1 Tax=Chromobacterium violaceum TaxID=536 RepID=UPI0035A74106